MDENSKKQMPTLKNFVKISKKNNKPSVDLSSIAVILNKFGDDIANVESFYDNDMISVEGKDKIINKHQANNTD